MAENDQYLFENTANMVYRDAAGNRTLTGLKLIAGVVSFAAQPAQSYAKNVSYAGEFNTGIKPVVTTGLIVTNANEHDSSITIRGLGDTVPNDAGFQFRWEMRQATKANQKSKGTVYCHYMALGVYTRVTAAPA